MPKDYKKKRDAERPTKGTFRGKKWDAPADKPQGGGFSKSREFKRSDDKDRPVRKSYSDSSAASDKPKAASNSGGWKSRDQKNTDRPYKGKFNSGDKPRTASRSYGSGEKKEQTRSNFGADRPRVPYKREGNFEERGKSRENFSSDARDEKPRRARISTSRKKVEEESDLQFGTVRLNKYIANAGICSRREADVLIATGAITVNGKIVSELGYKVGPTDVVAYGGQGIRKERNVYILLNKPKDYITTSDDPLERKTVMHLIKGACKERVYPVGRLDRNSTGLLILTNDGEMTKRLTHPRYEKKKIYHIELDRPLTKVDMEKILEGVELEDGMVHVDEISYVTGAETKREVGIELHSGKNRVIRRIFEHLNYEVKKLDRVYFAGLSKKDLPRGRWRFLTEREVAMLNSK